MKLNAGLFRLNSQPVVNLASEPPAESPDAPSTTMGSTNPQPHPNLSGSPNPGGVPDFVFFSLSDVAGSRSSTIADFVYAAFHRDARGMKTCKGCGGINHFEYENGKRICPTPENSVPIDMLKNIRYPVGVNPWRFHPYGKGSKGSKGSKGKGRGGDGRGRGRGGYWMYWQEDDTTTPTESTQEEPAPMDETPDGPFAIWEDNDGWNE